MDRQKFKNKEFHNNNDPVSHTSLVELVKLLARVAAEEDCKKRGLELFLWMTVGALTTLTVLSHWLSNAHIKL